jgi:hypothetical protein
MRCMNCNREIPKTAKICVHCESPVTPEPSAEELDAARALLDGLPPDALAELQQVFRDSATADEFVDRIFVGDCPTCASSNTGDCENDPEIGELLVGRCYDCGQLWCTECDKLLKLGATVCDCWDDDDFGDLQLDGE